MSFLLRCLSFFVGLMPDALMRLMARLLSWVVFSVFRYRRKVMAANIEQAFGELDIAQRRAIEKDACLHLALSLFEFLKIPRYAARNYEGVVRVEGWEHYRNAR